MASLVVGQVVITQKHSEQSPIIPPQFAIFRTEQGNQIGTHPYKVQSKIHIYAIILRSLESCLQM